MEEQSNFIVTARKWRPLRFSDVIGQSHITKTLQNALLNSRLHHAFMFCGPRGVGKTTTARIIGRAVNCLNLQADAEPCNECENCKSVIAGRSLDIIEIDGASNTGVDDVRQLRENAKYPPSMGKYKMYIIDEVHMLSNNAFNALLKILEEPPPHLMFVFATTESHKVPATIISRCQRFDFRRMEMDSIINQLRKIAEKENIKIDEKSILQIAKKADGSMRDSQSIFDQVVAFCGNNIEFSKMKEVLHLIDEDFFFRISNCILDNKTTEAFDISNEIVANGYELQEVLSGLLEHFRNILSVVVTGKTNLIETSDLYRQQYKETAQKTTKADILRYVQIINQTEASLRFAEQPRIKFELALIQMASLDKALEIKQLIEEIRNINEIPTEKKNEPIEIEIEQVAEKKNSIVEKEDEKPIVLDEDTQKNELQHEEKTKTAKEDNIQVNSNLENLSSFVSHPTDQNPPKLEKLLIELFDVNKEN